MQKVRRFPLQLFIHIFSLLPFVVLIWDYFTGRLSYNPLQEATLRTGKTALILLLLSLTCTPLNTVFGFRQVIKARRPLGLYAFFYALVHFLIVVGADYGFQFRYILADLSHKLYILVGLFAFIILLTLAITSTTGWQKRLKKKWKVIHRFVYLSAALVVIHYILLVKSDTRQPLIYGALLTLLLVLRIPAVRRFLSPLSSRYSLKKISLSSSGNTGNN